MVWIAGVCMFALIFWTGYNGAYRQDAVLSRYGGTLYGHPKGASVALLYRCLLMLVAMLQVAVAKGEDMHMAGLRPHHNTGATEEDPFLFRHRYQHHDLESGQLMYYQYEARRHAHVVMLADLEVIACATSRDEVNASLTVLTLVVTEEKLRKSTLTFGEKPLPDPHPCSIHIGRRRWSHSAIAALTPVRA